MSEVWAELVSMVSQHGLLFVAVFVGLFILIVAMVIVGTLVLMIFPCICIARLCELIGGFVLWAYRGIKNVKARRSEEGFKCGGVSS